MTDISPTRKGVLLVVSGPSGSGKTSLCQALSERGETVHSISCTTRPAREGERDGEHYHFISTGEFSAKESESEFLEHAEVHGRRYGTLKAWVLGQLEKGVDVVMDIDVLGAAQVRCCGDSAIAAAAVDVFVLPPSLAELRTRLEDRGTESEQEMRTRLDNALGEMRHWREYAYTIVSGSREDDYQRLHAILVGERNRSARHLPPPDAEYV
ncbi:MAG: guanylate kinase [Verrucomicrobiales bacterium]